MNWSKLFIQIDFIIKYYKCLLNTNKIFSKLRKKFIIDSTSFNNYDNKYYVIKK
jgi:hypothetical protein